LVLLIRARGNRSGVQRAHELLDEHAFRPLRERWGAAEVHRVLSPNGRVEIVEADIVADDFALPGNLDVVVHCAADTAFDRAADVAFTTNVVGGERLYSSVMASGNRPHLVHVSTAYVAGLRRGPILERPAGVKVAWQSETNAVVGLRANAELESRQPDILERLTREAPIDQGQANPSGVARVAEEARQDWITRKLSAAGRARGAFARFSRRLQSDQSAGRAGGRIDCPGARRAAVDHAAGNYRKRAGATVPRLDQGLQNG
jgi:hypothetical protein